MPLYEYECGRCHHRIEKIETYSAEPRRTCESCGGVMERQVSASAIQFKGSGWYVTDYARKSSAPPPQSDGGGKSDAAAPADKPAAEAKPAAAETKPAAKNGE